MGKGRGTNWGFVAAGIGLGAGLLWLFKKDVAAGVSMAVGLVKKELFIAALDAMGHDAAVPFVDIILQVADEKDVSPFIIEGIGWQESHWGAMIGGPGGIHPDGTGHGIMGIDSGSHKAWLDSHDWADPLTNVRYGIDVYLLGVRILSGNSPIAGGGVTVSDGKNVFVGPKGAARRGVAPGTYPDRRPLAGDSLTRAALAAYNTGVGNVTISLAVGLPADYTTNPKGNYSLLVTNSIEALTAAFNRESSDEAQA